MKLIRDKLIKLLGGYTEKEYNIINCYCQSLIDDTKTKKDYTYICNENIMRVLRDLDAYAINNLYGRNGDSWAKKMFNVIHNNYLRIITNYIGCKTNVIYRIDTSLDSSKEINKIIEDKKHLTNEIYNTKNNI